MYHKNELFNAANLSFVISSRHLDHHCINILDVGVGVDELRKVVIKLVLPGTRSREVSHSGVIQLTMPHDPLVEHRTRI